MTTTIAEYKATEAALAELRTKYESAVFNVTTGKGMTEAKSARAELRDYRVSLEKMRVEIKAPALERCRQIDSEAKRITAELESLEKPIDAAIKAEENRKAEEKATREREERARQEAINAKFNEIKALPLGAVNACADEIREQIAEAELIDTQSFPEDLRAAAQYEIRLAVAGLRAALDRRITADEEAARIAAEREELERLRAEQAEVLAEKERLAKAEREREAAEARAKEEAERAAREAAEAAARQAREAEQARIDAERAEARRKGDEARAEAEKLLRQQQAEAEAERQRLEAEKKAAAKLAREQAIANATLYSAAGEALALLQAEGFADHIVTKKLESALSREPEQKAA